MEVSDVIIHLAETGNGVSRGIALCQPGENLAAAIWLSGKVPPAPLCGGLGLCGRCKARFIKDAPPPTTRDALLFTSEELQAGWRLACGQIASGEIWLELPPEAFRRTDNESPGKTRGAGAVYAGIDLGTTSIQWRAETANGEIVMSGSALNPQAGAGGDVVSRLSYAMSAAGAELLARLAADALTEIFTRIKIAGFDLVRASIAANSAMTEIWLGKDISGLCAAPYALAYHGGEVINAGDAEIVIPPLPAPFVGGDISAGLLAMLESDSPRPFLLADLGTNAELALVDVAGSLYLASVPLGPALEGIGPRHGALAGKNVATGFHLAPGGLQPLMPPDSAPGQCRGISATGYLSLLALLFKHNILTKNGFFASPQPTDMPLKRLIFQNIQPVNGAPALLLPFGLKLVADDVEILLKVKAAFAVALKKLLALADLRAEELACFALAGALGQFASRDDLATLGFIPPVLKNIATRAGNSALDGACLLARNPEKLKPLTEFCASAKILALTEDPDFLQLYMTDMAWGWHDD